MGHKLGGTFEGMGGPCPMSEGCRSRGTMIILVRRKGTEVIKDCEDCSKPCCRGRI